MVNINATTPQLKATKDLFDAYFTRDLSNAEPLMSRDFKYHNYPKVAGHPEENKEEHLKKYGAILGSFPSVEPTILEVIEAEGKVVVHFTAAWTTVGGATLGYDSISILTFVEEDGQLKVLDIKDFTDANKRDAYHAEATNTLAKGIRVA